MNDTKALHALKKYFGYESFRPNQLDIIRSIYEGRDTLVLMPTGGGKSICYQIPALTLPGTAVVVSPLISLMKDQVEGLQAAGVRAAFLNSSLTSTEQRQIEDAYGAGELKLLYVSPEKLLSGGFFSVLRRRTINLFAIDEAHCISAWGHDFRPEYTRLKMVKEQFPEVPIIALTATADRLTRMDISEQLGLQAPKRVVASFDRPNLSLEVRPGRQRFEQILHFLQTRAEQSGILYCLSRKSTEELAGKLRQRGYVADAYHAGLPSDERDRVQEAFIKDEVPIICATIAFGMGIDKSNVRWIIHYNLPKNLENYYQEIGRAGRDGAPADTLLFYSYNDVQVLRSILTDKERNNVDIQLAKLERMQQYAESLACRRRILLSYFSEDHPEDCGNCDICRNPPQRFDGTVIAQMALSAVYRLRESTGLNMTIDVLRGSGRREVLEKGYHRIKTYGAGRKFTTLDWQHYLTQLINLGYLFIAHEQNSVLRLTEASKRVLFEGESVELVRMATIKERQEAEKQKKVAAPAGERPRVRDALFEQLRQVRKQLARERGLPPYVIFSDATLEEMAARRPTTNAQMARINGVGEKKLAEYVPSFMEVIHTFVETDPSNGKSDTRQQTLDRYQAGETIEAIAEARGLKPTTIYSHLAYLYAHGTDIDLQPLLPQATLVKVQQCLRYLEAPYRRKDIYDYLEGTVDYPQIDLALAYLQRNGNFKGRDEG